MLRSRRQVPSAGTPLPAAVLAAARRRNALVPTYLFRRSGSYDTVAHVGRWSSLHTTRRYISDAVAALASLQLDDWKRTNVAALSAEFQAWLSQDF